jgi:hypothetical protein
VDSRAVFLKRPNDPQTVHRETRGYPVCCIAAKPLTAREKGSLCAVFGPFINQS